MRLLILGGTVFLGRHLVDTALTAGHTITLFNRGRHNPDLFPEVERLRGDRDGDLESLRGRTWDAVIDPSGYVPRITRAAAEFLAGSVGHYTFISSLSVYADPIAPGTAEDGPLATLPAGQEGTETITGETYGALKVLAEQAAQAALPGRTLILRPGLIVGPHDPSDRFTYWPTRVARGGEVLAPGDPARHVQFIDVRDLAAWILGLVEASQTGVFNVTGPAPSVTMSRLLDVCRLVSGSDAAFTWVPEALLLANNVAPYTELPLWIPAVDAGFDRFDFSRALAAGLRFRPLETTIRDILAWDATRPPDADRRNGLKPEREAGLLAEYHRSP
jgi:2'-hydroxyisoflavone reductase